MKFCCLAISICVLFSLTYRGEGHSHVLVPKVEYWHAVWPNTPIPTSLLELVRSGPSDSEINDLHVEIDDTLYPKTIFFEHELHPSKIMNVQFSKHPFVQPYGLFGYPKHVKGVEKEGYTFGEVCIKKGAAKGEHKYCAKSLATLIGFAISKLGKNIQPLSSSFIHNQEEYTLEGIQNLGEKAVLCHRLNFQKVVFYCHEIHAATAFMTSLVANDGTKTQALVVCHTDTSAMNHDLLSQILKVDPGTKPVCHFLGNKAVLWVPNLMVNNAYNSNMAT